MQWVRKQCDVCIQVFGDMTIKNCTYCTVCKSYICQQHLDDIPARALAMAKKYGNKVATKVKEKLGV